MTGISIVVKTCPRCAAVGIAAVALSALALLLVVDRPFALGAAIVLWLGVVLFGAFALAILIPSLFRRPVLEANGEGVRVRYFFMGGFLPWSQVQSVRAFAIGPAKYLAIEPTDIELYIRVQRAFLRPFLRMIAKSNHPICSVLVDCGRSSKRHTELARAVRAIRSIDSEHAA